MIKYAQAVMASPAYNTLKRDVLTGNPSHCYVFASPDRYGCEVLTVLFLQLIFCESADKPCGKCYGCMKAENKTHADVKYYPEHESKLSAAEVSGLISYISYVSIESGKKVFVIKDIDEAHISVQNKLLKTLEEPPKDTVFILQAKSASSLLPTVKSRSRVISFQADADALCSELLSESNGKRQNSDTLVQTVSLSAGNIEKTLKFLDEPVYNEIFELITEFLLNCRSSKDVLTYSEKLQKYKTEYEFIFECLLIIFRDIYFLESGLEDRIFCKLKRSQYKSMLTMYNSKTVSRCSSRVIYALERLRTNGSAISIIDNLLLGIMEDKAKCQG